MKKNEYINTYCTGCGLCHSVEGIELKKVKGGFPNVNIQENQKLDFFHSVCPVFYYEDFNKYDVWGKIDRAYIGYSANPTIRFKAASGGALTGICLYLLEKKMVDGIIQITSDSNNPTKTITVVSTTAEEVKERCGSRYSISVPLENILQIIEPGKQYAFVGKPCDVMALRRYLKINVKLNDQIKFLLSFFCAGEPSVDAQKKLLNKMNCSYEECKSITYRGNGWPGYTTIIKKDGSSEKIAYKIAWGEYLGRDLRNICRFCLDGTGEAADIVCADFWYLDKNGNPDFTEHEGRNIIISRNIVGTKILDEAIADGYLVCKSDFTEEISTEFQKYQPAQYKRKGTMNATICAMKLCGRSTPNYNKECLKQYSKHLSLKIRGKYFIGIIKRVIKGRI